MKLPSPELEVVPPCLVYTTRRPEDYVKALLQLDVNDLRYWQPKLGTLCNRYVHDACVVWGVPMPRRPDGWCMLANQQVDHWSESRDWQKMVWQDAVMSANLGYPTVFGLKAPAHGHVGVVLPSNPIGLGDIMTAQAGRSNWFGKELKWAFKKDDLELVGFYGRA